MHSEVEIQHAQPGAQPVAQPVAASHDDRSEAALGLHVSQLAKDAVNFIRFISEEIVLKVLAASANSFSLDPSSQPVMVQTARNETRGRNGLGLKHL